MPCGPDSKMTGVGAGRSNASPVLTVPLGCHLIGIVAVVATTKALFSACDTSADGRIDVGEYALISAMKKANSRSMQSTGGPLVSHLSFNL